MTEGSDSDRFRWMERLLEMVPGIVSWAIIIGPVWLSFSYPWLVAYFVLSFDFYWLCRAVWFGSTVLVAQRRISRVLETNWGARLSKLGDRRARREALLRELARLPGPPRAGAGIQRGRDHRRESDGSCRTSSKRSTHSMRCPRRRRTPMPTCTWH